MLYCSYEMKLRIIYGGIMNFKRSGKHWIVNMKQDKRPKCATEGCNKNCQNMGHKNKNGLSAFRNVCNKCHSIKYEIGDWKYKVHRKDECSNRDGHLGFMCTSTIIYIGQLEVHHQDGNHENNDPSNLITYCSVCHTGLHYLEREYGLMYYLNNEYKKAA